MVGVPMFMKLQLKLHSADYVKLFLSNGIFKQPVAGSHLPITLSLLCQGAMTVY